MIVAIFTTPNFTFTAYGRGKKAATQYMMKALKKHGEQFELKDRWYTHYDTDESFIENNITYFGAYSGCVYRNEGRLI